MLSALKFLRYKLLRLKTSRRGEVQVSVRHEVMSSVYTVWRNRPTRSLAASLLRFIRHTIRHTHTHTHTREDSSEQVITSSQRSLVPTQQTQYTRDEHPCPQGDTNPRSEQSSACRPTLLDRKATWIGRETLPGLECRRRRAQSLYGNTLSSVQASKNFALINPGTQALN